jgi:uncharacterized integral membrane protein
MEDEMKFKLILVAVLAVLAGIVIMQNTQVVTFRLLFWQLTMSQILLLLVTLVVGFALGWVASKIPRGSEESLD